MILKSSIRMELLKIIHKNTRMELVKIIYLGVKVELVRIIYMITRMQIVKIIQIQIKKIMTMVAIILFIHKVIKLKKYILGDCAILY